MYSAVRPFSSKIGRVRSPFRNPRCCREISSHALVTRDRHAPPALPKRANSWLCYPHARIVTSVDHS
jgi:hypothetical protein